MAQPPAIVPSGILNAASKNPPKSPFGSIARGSRFEISGVRFGEAADTMKVSLTQTPNLPVRLISTASFRIECLLPAQAPLGRAAVTVSRGEETSKQTFIDVVPSNFGIFTANGEGWGPARFLPQATIGFATPARPGNPVTILGTGLGDESRPQVFVGGRLAPILKIERQPLGLDQITFRVPPGAPEGCFVPVYAKSARTSSPWVSNPATIPIASRGACALPSYAPAPPIPPGAVAGAVAVLREIEMDAVPEVTADLGFAAFYQSNSKAPMVLPVHTLPPPGTCTFAVGFHRAEGINSVVPFIPPNWNQLDPADVGPSLRLTRPGLERLLPQRPTVVGVYAAAIGDTAGTRKSLPLFLDPGSFTLSSQGGKSIGPFAVTIESPPDFTWFNHSSLQEIGRARGVELEWKNLAPGVLMIAFVLVQDRESGTGGACVCVAARGATRVRIPSDALAGLPIPGKENSRSYVGLAAIGVAPAGFRAAGLDQAAAHSILVRARQIRFN